MNFELFGMTGAELLAFFETQILPWVSALLLSLFYSVPMIVKYKNFAKGLRGSFSDLADVNFKNIDEGKRAIAEIKEEAKAVYEEFKKDVDALPITEIKDILKTSVDETKNAFETVKGFQDCFLLMFDFLYAEAMSSPILSQDEKENMKALHKKAKESLSKADLSEGMAKLKMASKIVEGEKKE